MEGWLKGKPSKKSGKVKDLRGKQLDAKNAGRVKDGFNPQPDPPKVSLARFDFVAKKSY